MKIRWTGGSLRLRITPTELAALARGEELLERVVFDERRGGWEIRLQPGGSRLAVRWEAGAAFVTLAAGDVEQLLEPDREGVYAHAPGLRILVEKDFPCAHPHAAEAAEPETERFAPTAGFVARKHVHHD